MSTPEPTQQPPQWGAYDYAAWIGSSAVWGTGKVLQYTILKPMGWIGEGARLLENTIYGNPVTTPPSLEEKEITISDGDDQSISSESALKTMQGQTDLAIGLRSQKDYIKELEDRVKELEAQLRKQQPEKQDESKEVLRSKKTVRLSPLNVQKSEEGPVESTVKKVEDVAKPESEEAPISDTVVEHFVSPLYDEEDQSEIIISLKNELHKINPGVDLNALLAPIPPVVKATGGPRRPQSPDQLLLNRLGIDATELKNRRDALKVVYKGLNDYIKTANLEIRQIKEKNNQPISRAMSFETGRKLDTENLFNLRTDLINAKNKRNAFRDLIKEYNELLGTDPNEASKMTLKFEQQIGTGTKTAFLSMKDVISKNLLEGYEQEVARIKNNIKNKIMSMNLALGLNSKQYEETLNYVSKTKSPDGLDIQEGRSITLGDFLKKEKSLRVARENLEAVRKNMGFYKVEIPKEKVEVKVVEEVMPDQKALDEELQKERLMKMKLEMQEKIAGLKPGNVAEYSFELVNEIPEQL